jgi:hypothetical protein
MVAVFGLVLGVLIWAGGIGALPRTVLGLTVVLVSLLLASAQSYPASLGALDARAAFPTPCGATCAVPVAPPGNNPALQRGSVMPDRHSRRPAAPTEVAGTAPWSHGAAVAGSVAPSCAHHTRCPVVLVPDDDLPRQEGHHADDQP